MNLWLFSFKYCYKTVKEGVHHGHPLFFNLPNPIIAFKKFRQFFDYGSFLFLAAAAKTGNRRKYFINIRSRRLYVPMSISISRFFMRSDTSLYCFFSSPEKCVNFSASTISGCIVSASFSVQFRCRIKLRRRIRNTPQEN